MEDSDKLLIAKYEDAVRRAEQRSVAAFIGFLNEREQSVIIGKANADNVKYMTFGGYSGAERVIFAALPDWADEESFDGFPIRVLNVEFSGRFALSHRDFLGTLMSLGITREKVGDIVPAEASCVIFLHEDIADYVISQLEKVGGVGVKISEGMPEKFSVNEQFRDIRDTVASNRLDCIVGGLTKLSRESSSQLIISGRVFIDSSECTNISKRVEEGAVISIRGKGKFIIDSLSGTSKKGRTILIARQKL